MATTTNYGWTTPDDTALVKDGASAIRSLGSSIDTTTKSLNPETTLGDISYRSSTSNTNTRLAIGTTGQVLTVSGGVPVWAAATGKLIQIISATYSTATTSTSATYADTGLSASITPTLNTSKILVFVSQPVEYGRSSSDAGGAIKLLRGSTDIYVPTGSNFNESIYIYTGGAATYGAQLFSLTYLDSPATTSATTYKTQFRVANTANSSYLRVQGQSATSSIVLIEIGA